MNALDSSSNITRHVLKSLPGYLKYLKYYQLTHINSDAKDKLGLSLLVYFIMKRWSGG